MHAAAIHTEKLMDGEAATVIVYGQISTANGAIPPRALMSMAAYAQGSCANPLMDAVMTVTNAAGEYRAALFNWGTEFTVCVSVRAAPAEGSGFLATSAQRAPVVMRSSVPDSVRVDFELDSDH
ncbi:MAG: hypothetical protein ACR2GJ_06215 [Gemmatimonadaceae bacterium]